VFNIKKENTSIKKILNNDEVKRLTEAFVNEHLKNTEGIIIIWATNRDLFVETAGLSEAEVIGSMQIMGHRIEHEGISR